MSKEDFTQHKVNYSNYKRKLNQSEQISDYQCL